MTAKLALQGVSKRFGDKIVLDGIDLEVTAGRSLVVIGGSGQGKSVTVKIAIGLMAPDAGRVLVDGQDVTDLRGKTRVAHAARFGMLFQGAALFDSLTVWENVAFRLLNADHVPRREAKARALDALAKVNLPATAADLHPIELSGGMQKRVGLARAVVAAPEILFFDEPTTGLDPISADVINRLIVEQVRRLGCTAVSITHDLASARLIGDEIAMLQGGQIVWRGPVDELDRSGNAYVEQFIHGRADGPITAEV
ncbi:MAG TPA: ATP-binding cassette domain-containing protein [Caulobacteraceae bacterium]|jgi:phospholipid/cholesterol/gamma-HCH transport system ATP-binding protein|nr:ATP-binding cassette domain-containing protein [Caulobacteraceae bacterium]